MSEAAEYSQQATGARGSAGAVFTAELLLGRMLRAAGTLRRNGTGGRVRLRLSAVEGPALEADTLNNWNLDKPRWLRRILRKQGRINRKLRDASAALADGLAASTDGPTPALLKARECFWRAQQLQHSGRGHPWIRRLRRPQGAFNEMLNQGLAHVAEELLARCPMKEGDTRMAEIVGHLRWNLAEVPHLNRRATGWRRLFARARRDQFMINRCHLAVLKQLCALVVPR